MEKAKPYQIPISPLVKCDLDESHKKVKLILFKGVIGSLRYLTTNKPDIIFSVCMCTHFQSNSKESHLSIVERIFKYLKGTHNMSLWYPRLD